MKKKGSASVEVQNSALLSTLLAVVRDGIAFLSPELEILYHNPAMQYWYETSGHALQEKCYALYQGREKPCENCPALRAMQTGKLEEEEVLFIRNSRRNGWQRVSCAPVFGENGQVEMIVEYVRDITDERNAVLSAELVEFQNHALCDLLEQKEEEHRRMEQKRSESMNQSFSSILRYLKATLDSHSFDLISRQLELLKNTMSDAVPEEKLSGQELTVARYVAEGYMSKEIADRMNLSKKTIDYYRGSIRKKLELGQSDDLKQAIFAYFAKTGISPHQ